MGGGGSGERFLCPVLLGRWEQAPFLKKKQCLVSWPPTVRKGSLLEAGGGRNPLQAWHLDLILPWRGLPWVLVKLVGGLWAVLLEVEARGQGRCESTYDLSRQWLQE